MSSKRFKDLPEFVKKGEFCVTLPNTKYPYDPFKQLRISALDPFYSFKHVSNVLEENPSWTLGLKVGSADISAIDIDNCITDGRISMLALNIINELGAYAELSPSMTGIRILFKTDTPFDIERYYVKNSALGIEYYDAKHCLISGARMVRLTGHFLYKGDANVDTSNFLEKYMKRPRLTQVTSELDDIEFNENRARVVSYLVNVLPDFYEFNSRNIDYLSESEWDLLILNKIAEYTDARQEIEYAFKNSRYYLTKDKMHLKKWNNQRYVTGTWLRVTSSEPRTLLQEWVKDIPETLEVKEPLTAALVRVLEEIGIIKTSNKPAVDKNIETEEMIKALIYAAEIGITARVWRNMRRKL